jgi:hypothetical protein
MGIRAVRDVLVASGAVTALVPADRIEPIRRTQSIAVPAIVLQRISVTPQNHLRGNGGLDANLVQLDVYASTYSTTRAVADAARAALEAGGFVMTSEVDGYEPDVDPELYRLTQSWQVWT